MCTLFILKMQNCVSGSTEREDEDVPHTVVMTPVSSDLSQAFSISTQHLIPWHASCPLLCLSAFGTAKKQVCEREIVIW